MAWWKKTKTKPAEGAGIVFSGRRYLVRERRVSADPLVVVTFDVWKANPGFENPFFGEDFFAARGINSIGVTPAENDWWQHDEIIEAIAAIRRTTRGMHRVGYGASMGGYGVINFADMLGLAHLVAICPQFSIDPRKAPYETRWNREAARIVFRHDRIAHAARLRHGTIVYDPLCVDGKHVQDIQKHHQLSEVKPFFGGHEQLAMLYQAGVLQGLLLSLVNDRFEPASFVRDLRSGRRNSPVFWLNLAEALVRRGAYRQAFDCVAAARPLQNVDRLRLDVVEGSIHVATGRLDLALSKLESWRGDPTMEEFVRWQIWQWQGAP
jgi:hypothetical protein